jgi:hypothetical protein
MKAPAGVILAVILSAGAAAAVVSPARATGPVTVAADRCNSRMINDYEGQIRDDDAHPPRDNPPDLAKRFNDIGSILNALNQERGIVESLCTSDVAKAPLFAQIGATAAWGLALESDIALRLNQPCPSAAKAFAAAILAQAWLDLASVVNDNNGKVPAEIAGAAPRIQTRAAAIGLTLPAYAETSSYWRDQIGAKAKDAVAACPTTAPSPSSREPSASPSAASTP